MYGGEYPNPLLCRRALSDRLGKKYRKTSQPINFSNTSTFFYFIKQFFCYSFRDVSVNAKLVRLVPGISEHGNSTFRLPGLCRAKKFRHQKLFVCRL
jgi:hypothetical protein